MKKVSTKTFNAYMKILLSTSNLDGMGGFCGAAAVAINRVFFNGEGQLVAGVNKKLWQRDRLFVGHVGVQVSVDSEPVVIDWDGPLVDGNLESWGQIPDGTAGQSLDELGLTPTQAEVSIQIPFSEDLVKKHLGSYPKFERALRKQFEAYKKKHPKQIEGGMSLIDKVRNQYRVVEADVTHIQHRMLTNLDHAFMAHMLKVCEGKFTTAARQKVAKELANVAAKDPDYIKILKKMFNVSDFGGLAEQILSYIQIHPISTEQRDLVNTL